MNINLWRSKLPSLTPVANEVDDIVPEDVAGDIEEEAEVAEICLGSDEHWEWDDDNPNYPVTGQIFSSSQESLEPLADRNSRVPLLPQTLKSLRSSTPPPSIQTTQPIFTQTYARRESRSLSPSPLGRSHSTDEDDFNEITGPMGSLTITTDDHDHVGSDFEPPTRLRRRQAQASVTGTLPSSSSNNIGYSQTSLTVSSAYSLQSLNTISEPPQTPAKKGVSSSSLLVSSTSTPGHIGSASAGKGQGFGKHRVVDIRGHFAMDVVRHSRVDFRVMLGHLLARVAVKKTESGSDLLDHCLPIAIKICENSRAEIEVFLKDYGKATTETHCYPFLIGLSNLLLNGLKSHSKEFTKLRAPSPDSSLDIKYEVNDSIRLKQSHGDQSATLQSLDIIASTKSNIERASISDKGQVSLEWVELLQTWEIKRSLSVTFKKGKPFTTRYFTREHITNVNHSFKRLKRIAKNSAVEIVTQTKAKTETRRSSRLVAKSASVPSTSTSIINSTSTQENMYCDIKPKDESQLVKEENQIRQDKSGKRPPPLVQMAIYAGEFLSRGPFTLHVINLLVVDELMWIWWYDRQNAIQTTAIDFFQSLPYLVCLLAAFQRFELRDWGIEPSLIHGGGLLTGGSDFDFTFKDGIVVTVSPNEPIFSQLSLRGRATRVLNARFPSDPSRKLALKTCWPEESRMNEALLIKLAISRLTQADKAHLIDHLPEVLCFEDFDYSTGDINKALGITPDKSRGPRRLRAILFTYLDSIETLLDFNDPAIVFKAWFDCFICHFNLWVEDIHHGDISLWNLMWNPDKGVGVLNDFDLIRAHNVTEDELIILGINGVHNPLGLNSERTGTIPFMALDLLTKEYFAGEVPRLYRHDVESFIWVLTWLCLYGVTDEQNALLAEWKTGEYKECKEKRSAFLFDTSMYQCRDGFDNIWDFTRGLLDDIIMDRMRRNKATFTEPSSAQVFDNILSQVIVALPKEWHTLE